MASSAGMGRRGLVGGGKETTPSHHGGPDRPNEMTTERQGGLPGQGANHRDATLLPATEDTVTCTGRK